MYKSRYLERIKRKAEPASDEPVVDVVADALARYDVPILETKRNAFDRAMDRYSISSAVISTAPYRFSSSVYCYPRR